jgi:hypothetical protein
MSRDGGEAPAARVSFFERFTISRDFHLEVLISHISPLASDLLSDE